MSLKIEIEVTINTILAVQEAAKQDTSPASLQLARNLSFQAMRTAVEQLPYDVNRKGDDTRATAPTPESKRPPPCTKPTPHQTKKVKTESGDIQIYVKDTSGSTWPYVMRDNDLVDDLKSKIHVQLVIPPDTQRLIFSGVQLEDGRRLDHVSLTPEIELR